MKPTNSTTNRDLALMQKIRDYALLGKLRLSLLVVFSAVITYSLGVDHPSFQNLSVLALGGCLITFAANALNQVLEKDYDKLMARTAQRPLPAGRMEVAEAVLAAGLMSVLGLFLLASFNPLTAVLGAVSLVSYAFIYTPMKRVSPAAVWIGAVPGALPMAIGWTAATGKLGSEALALFSIQFIWQFPHFWAVAWVAYEDYAKAGFYLLPSRQLDGRNKSTALQAVAYAALLIPVSFLPWMLGITGIVSAVVLTILACLFTFAAVQLYAQCTRKAALRLMFSSLIYLSVALIVLLLDKA